jgi:hypothetical protein
MIKENIEDYVLFFALSGYVTPREDTWLIDIGASKNIIGQRDVSLALQKRNFPRNLHSKMITSTLSKEWENPPTKLIQGTQ